MKRPTALPGPHRASASASVFLALAAAASIVVSACVGSPSTPVATNSVAPAAQQGSKTSGAPGPTRAAAPEPATAAAVPTLSATDWPNYHYDSQHTGNYPSFPTFGGSVSAGWSAALDGAVYAEPLVVNGEVIAATEGDSVYALNPSTGSVIWHRNVGTPVPLSTLPCGDIDPLGITGTPAYDPITNSIFAVAEVTGPAHDLFALDPATGVVKWSRNIDLAGDDPRTHQQRPGLTVANGYVYVGFGGLDGDCGQYVGEVVGVPATGSGATISYKVPTSREGAVWAGGGAPTADASGNLYVSVGNGASTTTFDGTDSVVELSPSLQLVSFFAPSSWASDNAADADLGSLAPVLVPGGWVFIAGKSGTGYVLKQGALGGIGGQVQSAAVCTGFGGAAEVAGHIYVPCFSSLREVQVGASGSLTPGWQTSAAGGPPVLGGGVVWSVNFQTGRLVALDPGSGATLASISVGATPHFVTPTLYQNRVLVGTNAGISTAVVPIVPPAPATFHAINPTRLVDSRVGLGISGAIGEHLAHTFQVTGGVVPSNAVAVTGNLTVTGQSSKGYLSIGPNPVDLPTTSTLNFPVGDDRANAVTSALGAGGTLAVTFVAPTAGKTANVVFDVTGYFTADTSGATYHALNPARILDSRDGTGGFSTPLQSHVARTFGVAGASGVPSNATAVTGTLTVTGQTRNGFLFIGPVPTNAPTSSTLNFPINDDRANSVTVALSDGSAAPRGSLSVTFAAPGPGSAQAIFDVTGYFTPDSTGSRYVALSPARVLDTRDGTGGLTGPSSSHVARTFSVAGAGGVPSGAIAVSGNLTVTGQTRGGYLFAGPIPTNDPSSSTLNFPVGDDRANGIDVALGTGSGSPAGSMSITYVGSSPGTAQVIFDVTGYFAP